jgi:hypothetical protein
MFIKNLSPKKTLVFLVFGLQFTLIGLAMRLDPDPHHDGILYGAAVRVSNGGFPNRDVFAQYGPLIPELQGLWLRIFGPSLLNIRMQALIIFILCSIAIWFVAKKYFSSTAALVISSTWILALPSLLPWPNIYTTLISIISLLILIDLPQRRLQTNPIRIMVSSSLIGIGTFGRIHLFAVFALVLVYFVISSVQRRKIMFWFFGYFGTVFTILVILFLNNALSEFATQSITWPLKYYAGPDIDKSYIVGLFWYPVIFFFLVLAIMFTRRLNRITSSVPFSIIVTTSIFLLLLLISKQDRVGDLTLTNPRILAIDSARNMLNSLNYTAALIMLVASVYLLFNLPKIKPDAAISVLYSAGLLTQLYPLYDVNHLWLISPMLIIGLIISFGDSRRFSTSIKKSTVVVLSGLSIALVVQLLLFVSTPRVSFISPSLKGMFAPAKFAAQLDETMLELAEYASPASTVFECDNGIYAGSGGKYLAASPQFVNWGPLNESLATDQKLFICGATSEAISQKINLGYEVLFRTPLVYFGSDEVSGLWNVLFKPTN